MAITEMVLPMSVINLWPIQLLWIWFLVIGWCNEGNIIFENSTKLKKPFIIKPLLKRAMKQEMKMTTNMQLRTRTLATWTSAIWDRKMVNGPISCPLTGLMYQCVFKASCLTFTVLIRKCNFSLGCFYPICLNVNKC